MKIMKYKIAIALAAFLTYTVNASADGEKDKFNPVSTAVNSLKIGADARAGGMGDIGAATDPDVNSPGLEPREIPVLHKPCRYCCELYALVAKDSKRHRPWIRCRIHAIG